MEEVIKKWELILQQDSDRDITYGRKVLEEMLIDVKQAAKNCSMPAVMQQSEQLKAFLEELTMPDTRNPLYIQNKAKELLKAFNCE